MSCPPRGYLAKVAILGPGASQFLAPVEGPNFAIPGPHLQGHRGRESRGQGPLRPGWVPLAGRPQGTARREPGPAGLSQERRGPPTTIPTHYSQGSEHHGTRAGGRVWRGSPVPRAHMRAQAASPPTASPSRAPSPASPTITDHSDRSRRARSRPSEERSGAGGRRRSHWLPPRLVGRRGPRRRGGELKIHPTAPQTTR